VVCFKTASLVCGCQYTSTWTYRPMDDVIGVKPCQPQQGCFLSRLTDSLIRTAAAAAAPPPPFCQAQVCGDIGTGVGGLCTLTPAPLGWPHISESWCDGLAMGSDLACKAITAEGRLPARFGAAALEWLLPEIAKKLVAHNICDDLLMPQGPQVFKEDFPAGPHRRRRQLPGQPVGSGPALPPWPSDFGVEMTTTTTVADGGSGSEETGGALVQSLTGGFLRATHSGPNGTVDDVLCLADGAGDADR
jgi:hypothetical protein